MNATSVPSVIRPWPAAYAPKPSTTISVTLGMISSSVQNFADTATLRTWVAYSVPACSSKRW